MEKKESDLEDYTETKEEENEQATTKSGRVNDCTIK